MWQQLSFVDAHAAAAAAAVVEYSRSRSRSDCTTVMLSGDVADNTDCWYVCHIRTSAAVVGIVERDHCKKICGRLRLTGKVKLSTWCSIVTLSFGETILELQAVKVSRTIRPKKKRKNKMSPGISEPLLLRDAAKTRKL